MEGLRWNGRVDGGFKVEWERGWRVKGGSGELLEGLRWKWRVDS